MSAAGGPPKREAGSPEPATANTATVEDRDNQVTACPDLPQGDEFFDVISLILPSAFSEMHPDLFDVFPTPSWREVQRMPLRFFVGSDSGERRANRKRCALALLAEEIEL